MRELNDDFGLQEGADLLESRVGRVPHTKFILCL